MGSETHEVDGIVRPQKRWKFFVRDATHFDLGYTALQSDVMKVHRDNLDLAMRLCRKYPGMIWNLEGSFLAEDYLANGSDPRQFLSPARQGRIGIMGLYGNLLTGICSSESLTRAVDYYDLLRNKYGIASGYANVSDVPTVVGTLPMILAGHGIKYVSLGINGTRTNVGQDLFNVPYYWQSPDGSKVMSWKTNGYYQFWWFLLRDDDLPADTVAKGSNDLLGYMVPDALTNDDYPFDAVFVEGAYADNQRSTDGPATVPDQWNKAYSSPQLILCRGPEYFEYIEANFPKQIKTVKEDGCGWWEDGCGWWEDGAGSSARETAITRQAKEKLITVEKLSVLCGKKFEKHAAADISEAWKNILLYDEHTWGAAASVSNPFCSLTLRQWADKKAFADRAAQIADDALNKAADKFCESIQCDKDSVVVFNPSSWERSEWVTCHEDGGPSIQADNVPPMGYKVFSLPKLRDEKWSETTEDFLDNAYYKVGFDKTTGAVNSIYDKELKRELVDSSSYGVNQYLYTLTGGHSVLLSPGNAPADLGCRLAAAL